MEKKSKVISGPQLACQAQIRQEKKKVERTIKKQKGKAKVEQRWLNGFESSMGKKAFYGKCARGPTLDDYDKY